MMDAEFDEAVREENSRALLNVFSEGFEGGADFRGGAFDFARGDDDFFSGDQHEGLVIDELGGADFGALQVAQDTERLTRSAAHLADHLDEGQLSLVASVRKIETSHIQAGAHQLAKDWLTIRG